MTKLITFMGLFICVYSGVVFIILAVHSPNIPSIYSHLAWVSISYIVYLNLLIIGLGILIGSIFYNKFSQALGTSEQIKIRTIKLDVKKNKIFFGILSILGLLVASVMFGYFFSLIIFISKYYTNSVEFAELFLTKFMITYLFFLLGLFIFFLGFYIIKNYLTLQKTTIRTGIPRFLKKKYKILITIISAYSGFIVYIFGSAVYAIFFFNNYYFVGPYPPTRFEHELMGFLLAVLSVFLLIHSLTITYFVRAIKYERKLSYMKKKNFQFKFNFIIRVGSILILIITFMLVLQSYFYFGYLAFLFHIVSLIIYPWFYHPWGYSESLTITLLLIQMILISCIVFLIPRRKYEVINNF
ncbi:MAG: hypothetical protein ACFFA7_16620 [Promethearchaeota archaeon]